MFKEVEKYFINKDPFLKQQEIETIHMGKIISKDQFYIRVKTVDGTVYIKFKDNEGKVLDKFIEIPPIYTLEDRDNTVRKLRNEENYLIEDIKIYLRLEIETIEKILNI